MEIVYRGLPIKPCINGIIISWMDIIKYIKAEKDNYVEVDGWRFQIDYAMIYFMEKKHWGYYIPPLGVKDKNILCVGGGCGETAKYYLDNGAFHVHVIENNPICKDYLIYNHFKNNKMTFSLKDFDMSDISYIYDLLQFDIEGYELLLLPILDKLNIDIVLESHCTYITDRFIEKGFKEISRKEKGNKKIYGGVVQLCRLKK
ncbi:MAG: hypothetical protein MUO21_07870 [Nitrososphaeraceae archaeon]|nr:hypothetical protein [Nitrososphaeraceae archaeon]